MSHALATVPGGSLFHMLILLHFIQKLADAVGGDLDGLAARFRATREVSLNYKNFAGASEDMDGQVKFIYRTDSIE